MASRYCASLVDARLAGGAIGVRAGVTGARLDDTPAALVERADAAMYAHKRSNRAAPLAAGSSPCITMRVRTLMR